MTGPEKAILAMLVGRFRISEANARFWLEDLREEFPKLNPREINAAASMVIRKTEPGQWIDGRNIITQVRSARSARASEARQRAERLIQKWDRNAWLGGAGLSDLRGFLEANPTATDNEAREVWEAPNGRLLGPGETNA